jgi:hypothetical protein
VSNPSPISAHQRFIARQKLRAAERRRRRQIGGIFALALGLTSCVATLPVTKLAVGLAEPTTPDVPVIAAAYQAEATPAAIAKGPNFLIGRGSTDRTRATLCLASAIYYEAATEPDEGQRAVAQVVLNRVRHPAWPHTVCGVVYQGSDRPGCQFSFACDGAMARRPMFAAWLRAFKVAEAALAGDIYTPVGSSTFYHTTEVSPAWRFRMIATGIVGAHIFYRQGGDGETADSLPFHYAGGEPTPGPLPRVAAPADLMRLSLANLQMPSVVAMPAQPVQLSAAPAYQSFPAADMPAAPKKTVENTYIPGALPDSDIRPEFKNSGQWIEK